MTRRTQAILMIASWMLLLLVGVPLSDTYKPWGGWIATAAGIMLLFWLLRLRSRRRAP